MYEVMYLIISWKFAFSVYETMFVHAKAISVSKVQCTELLQYVLVIEEMKENNISIF